MVSARTYDRLWRALLRLRFTWPITRFRCDGSRAAQTWIDHPQGGYYRWGIQRQYCVRLAGHRGPCEAMITRFGVEAPHGSNFTPRREAR